MITRTRRNSESNGPGRTGVEDAVFGWGVRRGAAVRVLAAWLGLVAALPTLVRTAWAAAPDDTAPPTCLSLASDVRQFGALGDGQADDTAAIQKAVDSGIGTLRFGKGTYRITRPIEIELDRVGFVAVLGDATARLVMAGPGPALRFLGTHAGTADPPSVKPDVWARQRTPTVDGLEIVGDHPEADGIEAAGTMQLTIRSVCIRKVRHGIHLVRRNRNVLIAACHIYENRGVGIFYDEVNLHQSNIVGCHISYCAGGGIVSRGGDVRNIHIGTCDIESNMSPEGPPTANVLLDSTNGSVGEVAITGCTIQHNSPSPQGANIRILGGGEGGPRIGKTQEGHVTIGDNVLSDVQINLHIQNARGITITGNTFWMGYTYNLLAEDSSNIVVGPNAFDRNPRYNYGTSLEAKNALLVRNCADCTLTGLHINGVYKTEAGLVLENCRRCNITACTILDCENVGLLWKNVSDCRLSDCLIRNDLKSDRPARSLLVLGGQRNMIVNNVLQTPFEIPEGAGMVQNNYPGN